MDLRNTAMVESIRNQLLIRSQMVRAGDIVRDDSVWLVQVDG